MKKTSIVLITSNEESNIDACLQTLLYQTYPDYEILVIDASEDTTVEKAAKYDKVKVIKSHKKGFGAQRNLGIKLSQGQYIAFTDADCRVPKDWLYKQVTYLEQNNAIGVGGNAYPPEDSPKIGKLIACLGYPAGGALGLDLQDSLSTCNALFVKEALEYVHGFREDTQHGGEDTELCKRLKAQGYKLLINLDSYIYHNTRTFKEFLHWNIRRGRAKYHLNKSIKQLLMPLSIFIYPFTLKYRKVFTKRKGLNLRYSSILFVVPTLFFLRQIFMTYGWIQEALQRQ